MLTVLEEQKIFENLFNTYFADKTYGHLRVGYETIPKDYTRLSWLESKALQVKMRRFEGYSQWKLDLWYTSHCRSVGGLLTGLGTGTPGWTIPDSLLTSTYSFRFRVLPEERLIENAPRDIMWFGGGWSYRQMDGRWMSVPLFRIFIDPLTNHLYLIFEGRANYDFGSWTYDLGHVDTFVKWTNFTLWMDLENKIFKKLWIGKEIPFPVGFPGYEEGIHPNAYGDEMYNGMYTGVEIQDVRPYTNITFEIDDVEVWTGYHPPGLPPWPPGWDWEEWLRRNLWWLIALGSIGAGGVMTHSAKKEQEKGR